MPKSFPSQKRSGSTKGRQNRRQDEGQRSYNDAANAAEQTFRPEPQKVNKAPLVALNRAQQLYMSAIEGKVITFADGDAGVGKTYLAGAMAAIALEKKEYEKIIITRPAVEAGEKLGYLPGEKEEKYAPYLQPFRDVLDERLGKSFVDYLLKVGRIEAAPLAYMRGRTFRNAFVILDEAQNTTPEQMKMFLTRIGDNCKVVVNGDSAQKDIPGPSGLADAITRLSFIPSISVVKFTERDSVRSEIVKEMLTAYKKEER